MIKRADKSYITEKEASFRFGYSIQWFQEKRRLKLPPYYIKCKSNGRIFYELDYLEKWFKNDMEVIKEGEKNDNS